MVGESKKSKKSSKEPVEVKSVEVTGSPRYEGSGNLVKVRPCAKEYADKTFLGIYLGELPVVGMSGTQYDKKKKHLSIHVCSNPAIFIPELKKIVFGYESWWGEIKSEEELKQITNEDINNVWYVKALKELAKKKAEKKDGN